MPSRLAILSDQPGVRPGDGRIFGKDVANFALFQAIARHGGLDRLDMLMVEPAPAAELATLLLAPGAERPAIASAGPLATDVIVAAGTVLRGSVRIDRLAWQRRRATGDHGYSLIGLIHTLGPPAVREDIGQLAIGPVMPWDALVCTSPAVRDATVRLFDEWEAHLGQRTGGGRPPRVQLPVIPLGVDLAAMTALADRPDVRAATRDELGMSDDDVLLLWVGRLSFFEKAFPQPMLRAAEQAAKRTGVRVHFVMAGWFPDAASQEPMYRAVAAAHAPSVAFHIVDGTEPARRDALWAAADIFVSLVDNVQETFGLTPIEAMAAGLPVVVSDWDGYRYTVRDGEDGFLIPSLIGPPGVIPEGVIGGHDAGLLTYQQYAGILAQHSAIAVERAASAIAALVASPGLRKRMGGAGRARVREMLDWPVVARAYAALADELAAIRAKASPTPPAHHPLRGDPFRDFAGFASAVLTPETRFVAADDAEAVLAAARGLALDMFGARWRADPDEAARLLAHLRARGEASAAELIGAFPPDRHRASVMSLLWMAKLGMIEWLAG